MLNIVFFYEAEFPQLQPHQHIEKTLKFILDDHGKNLNWLNIIIVDDEALLKINKDFLQHDYFTDIITFNYSEEPSEIEAELYISGDMVISNAKKFKVDVNEELNRVIIHGTLHLAGYDDQSKTEKKQMQTLEDKYLNMLSSTWNI